MYRRYFAGRRRLGKAVVREGAPGKADAGEGSRRFPGCRAERMQSKELGNRIDEKIEEKKKSDKKSHSNHSASGVWNVYRPFGVVKFICIGRQRFVRRMDCGNRCDGAGGGHGA